MGSKSAVAVALYLVIAGASPSFAQSPQQPTGTWANETGNQQFVYGGYSSDGTYMYIYGGYQYGFRQALYGLHG